jgi:hypothetical protein
VRAAHVGLMKCLQENLEPVPQDKSRELRYTRNADFTDAVATEYLQRLPTPSQMKNSLDRRDLNLFLRPQIY